MILFAALAAAQSGTETQTPASQSAPQKPSKPGGAGDIGGGAASIGEGAAKGAGHLAEGTAKGAADLVTLHPVSAAASLGGGAASAGKNVAVGSAKGLSKISRGVGKLFKKVL